MRRYLRQLIVVVASLAVLLLPATPALAASDVFGNACNTPGAANSAICKDKTSQNKIYGKDGILTKVVRILGVLAGAVAIIMIIVSGLRYILSEGDPAKATAARNGLIYALVGLIIIIAAQAIIQFVLSKIYQ